MTNSGHLDSRIVWLKIPSSRGGIILKRAGPLSGDTGILVDSGAETQAQQADYGGKQSLYIGYSVVQYILRSREPSIMALVSLQRCLSWSPLMFRAYSPGGPLSTVFLRYPHVLIGDCKGPLPRRDGFTTARGSCHLCITLPPSASPSVNSAVMLTAHSASSNRRSKRYRKSTGIYIPGESACVRFNGSADVRDSVLQRHETKVDCLCEWPDFPVGDQGGCERGLGAGAVEGKGVRTKVHLRNWLVL